MTDDVQMGAVVTAGPPSGRFTTAESYGLDGVSHELSQLPEGHKCWRNHGHNCEVTLTLTAERLDGFGFATDFGELRPFRRHLESFDHRRLNGGPDHAVHGPGTDGRGSPPI